MSGVWVLNSLFAGLTLRLVKAGCYVVSEAMTGVTRQLELHLFSQQSLRIHKLFGVSLEENLTRNS
jgi:hypothetical protein